MESIAVERASPLQPGDLPERLFATNCYPGHAVRLNSYSTPKYLIEILNVLEGTPELNKLLASPLGCLFSLPVRRSSLSGQLVHQMLCRQIVTDNVQEMWFVFGGCPIRFSLTEFHEVTGLCCAPYPPKEEMLAAVSYAEGSSPYWYKLIGGKLGCVTIKEIMSKLKTEPNMPSWKKFRLSLVVIIEGILMSRTQPLKPSVEVVEMVKDVDFFLNYPWGRHSFQRTLKMLKVGDYIQSKASLVDKLKQSSLAVHGFPLAIQLLAFKCVPGLLAYLRHSDDSSTFLDQTITRLPKCKSFHTGSVMDVEYDSDLQVLFPQALQCPFLPSDEEDPKIRRLERLISSGFRFTRSLWVGGDALLPPLRTYWKHKVVPSTSDSSSCQMEVKPNKHKRKGKANCGTVGGDAELLFENLKSFKESLLVEVRELILNNNKVPERGGPSNSSSRGCAKPSASSQRVKRGGCLGSNLKTTLQRSVTHSQHSILDGNPASSCGTAPVSGYDNAPLLSQQSESVVRASVERLRSFVDLTNSDIRHEVSSPAKSGNFVSASPLVKASTSQRSVSHTEATVTAGKYFSRSRNGGGSGKQPTGVDVCGSGKTIGVKKIPRHVSLVVDAFNWETNKVGQSSPRPLASSSVKPLITSLHISTPADDVSSPYLFNDEPDRKMGFILVDPSPEALSSAFPTKSTSEDYLKTKASVRQKEGCIGNSGNGDDEVSGGGTDHTPPTTASAALKTESGSPSLSSSPAYNLRSRKVFEPSHSTGKGGSRSTCLGKRTRSSHIVKVEGAQQVLFSSRLPNLRSRKVAKAIDVKDPSDYIVSGLEKPDPSTLSKFLMILKKTPRRLYNIDGNPFPRTMFEDISKPKHWVTSLYIDLMISFGWNKYGAFLASRRVTILDSMFTNIIGNKFMNFKEDLVAGKVVWHKLLIDYIRGSVAGRSTHLQWIRDVDVVYMPMNWGKRHWVGLSLDLSRGHINILDPFEDLNSPTKVVAFVSPFAKMLPSLVQSVCGGLPSTWSGSGLTFARLPGLPQNSRGGDCGPLAVKFMELHSHGQHQALAQITPQQVDALRMRYAIDLYEEYVEKI